MRWVVLPSDCADSALLEELKKNSCQKQTVGRPKAEFFTCLLVSGNGIKAGQLRWLFTPCFIFCLSCSAFLRALQRCGGIKTDTYSVLTDSLCSASELTLTGGLSFPVQVFPWKPDVVGSRKHLPLLGIRTPKLGSVPGLFAIVASVFFFKKHSLLNLTELKITEFKLSNT